MSAKTSFITRLALSTLLIALVLGAIQFLSSPLNHVQAVVEEQNSSPPFGASYAVVHDMPISDRSTPPDEVIYDPVKGRLYGSFAYGDLIVFDVNTGETTVLEYFFDIYSRMASSPDGNYLYVRQGYKSRIDVYETTSFSLINSYAAPTVSLININFVADTNNRLYFAMPKTIEVLNASTGAVIQSYKISDFSNEYLIDISPDNKFLYLAPSERTDTLYKFDISNGSLTELKSVQLEGIAYSLDVSGDGKYITMLLTDSILVVYDAQTLAQIHSVPNQPGGWMVDSDAAIDDGNQFFGLSISHSGNLPTVYTWDALSGNMLHKYTNRQPSPTTFKIISIGEDRIAIVLRDTVKVLTPTYYGVALPIIMNDYCTSPIVDDFSDPASGWPVGSSGSITYQYLNGEYNIFHSDDNRWTAVTRGLVWDNSKQIELEGRLATDREGLWGLLYGLNNNWTDFYTFEILPNDQIWAILHFTSTNGWEAVASGTSGAIRTGTATNRLRITQNQTNSSAGFYINDVLVRTEWYVLPTGRIGLTGGSFQGKVDLRYDNFLFVDTNCPIPSQLNSINGEILDSLIIQDRPLLDSLRLNITHEH